LTRREKIEKFEIFRGNFPNPNHVWLTQPHPIQVKKFDPGPSLMFHVLKKFMQLPFIRVALA